MNSIPHRCTVPQSKKYYNVCYVNGVNLDFPSPRGLVVFGFYALQIYSSSTYTQSSASFKQLCQLPCYRLSSSPSLSSDFGKCATLPGVCLHQDKNFLFKQLCPAACPLRAGSTSVSPSDPLGTHPSPLERAHWRARTPRERRRRP